MEFKYDLHDLKFILKEWLPMKRVYECQRYAGTYGEEDIDILLNEAYKIAREVIQPLQSVGDKVGVRMEEGKVVSPPGYKEAFQFLQQNGWGSSSECIEIGSGMPLVIAKAISELFSGACTSLTTNIKLTTGAANLIIKFGRQEDKDRFLPGLLNGKWQGTMCLTEPSAGSDVGDALTRAYPTDDPRLYKIKGTKMFITAGDGNMTENTIHMVLARPVGGAPGSAGLGLFIVPKVWVNNDGSLGKTNDVTTVSIEEKMGLHGSVTAMLNFGENDECYGILVGPPMDENGKSAGLAMMFHMMNESRMATGAGANAQASAAYFYACQYAHERIQGRSFSNPRGERVPIIEHIDIKRMLMDMKAHTEGIRAMIYKGFYALDMAENSKDKHMAKEYANLAAILTPLIKCYSSETCALITAEAIQVFGGVGYTREYPVEQYLRDSKILTIWEGTSFIQSQDLVSRKMRMKNGEPFSQWLNSIAEFARSLQNISELTIEMNTLSLSVEYLRQIKSAFDSWYADADIKGEFVPLYAYKTLLACAKTQVGQCLLEQAVIALNRLAELDKDDYERRFYEGKLASARYYVNNILPEVLTLKNIISSEEDTVLTMKPDHFII